MKDNDLIKFQTLLELQDWEAFQHAECYQKGIMSQLKLQAPGIPYCIQLSFYFFHGFLFQRMICASKATISSSWHAESRWICYRGRSWCFALRRARTCQGLYLLNHLSIFSLYVGWTLMIKNLWLKISTFWLFLPFNDVTEEKCNYTCRVSWWELHLWCISRN